MLIPGTSPLRCQAAVPGASTAAVVEGDLRAPRAAPNLGRPLTIDGETPGLFVGWFFGEFNGSLIHLLNM